jgi:hypothetical protein
MLCRQERKVRHQRHVRLRCHRQSERLKRSRSRWRNRTKRRRSGPTPPRGTVDLPPLSPPRPPVGETSPLATPRVYVTSGSGHTRRRPQSPVVPKGDAQRHLRWLRMPRSAVSADDLRQPCGPRRCDQFDATDARAQHPDPCSVGGAGSAAAWCGPVGSSRLDRLQLHTGHPAAGDGILGPASDRPPGADVYVLGQPQRSAPPLATLARMGSRWSIRGQGGQIGASRTSALVTGLPCARPI